MWKFLAGMIVMAGLGALVTKPSVEAAEAELQRQVTQAVANERLQEAQALDAALLLACRLDPQTCYSVLRSGITLSYEDRLLYARVDLDGFGLTATCYGLYTRFLCPGGLQADE
ncbi:hypothetical protein [Pseudoponticoccus marisrubri]|uniref:Uncharacterized protein n=1 Tax=Pseudoponticoccus marisrubri TaxID=1685382 RepID=A0A0W7WFG2_9RHOB|nr:hypothetical protein [Pseudoponticoccus marisrubri]KUF09321.1 hypothetical protein AVJ23_17920 [Pseudoponticoccus marisrubri]